MQEEIENRTVTLIISAVKLTARELKAGTSGFPLWGCDQKYRFSLKKAGIAFAGRGW